MSETHAVPSEWLARAAMGGGDGTTLCPACTFGRLHPFKITIGLTVGIDAWHGANYLEGWVAVCRGAKAGEHFVEVDQASCGFSLPMTPRTWDRPGVHRA